ncbi:serine/threonine protein phosphatase [Xanthomonas sp. CFBP 8445]|uniref:serine/threonine protein phosphatase n=1 Tax=Xanthomonas sp. CFBP 8445 TaxID=2971236 RepID=UPI0021E0A423|nr:serine/threonine protein phosphatase [Xanthomonas sp. CFBP 8445]UYC11156.1 serine/threonine protein phosphatase [Xanthomonas sp. CFBP 8445]
MAEPILIDGQRVWLKQYGMQSRRLALAALRLVARCLHLHPLRPPPHHGGERARQVEARRLAELRGQAVHVPDVLGGGHAALVISDNGQSLAHCLRQAQHAPRRLDALVAAAVAAIAAAHRRGAYLGQPLPRNMTYDGACVGFLDFEEDPLEVMTLEQAQARDWLLFGYGVAKYYDTRPQALAGLMRAALCDARAPVRDQTHQVTTRLQRLARAAARCGRSARALAHAILVLHAASVARVGVALAVLADWCSDGDLDLLQWLL